MFVSRNGHDWPKTSSSRVQKRITVVGCGHVGLVVAAAFAELGHQVTGYDIDHDVVSFLNRGEVILREPGLEVLVRKNLAAARLIFTSSACEAYDEPDFVFFCVDTPVSTHPAPDMSRLRDALMEAVEMLAGRQSRALLVIKSTPAIGTTEALRGLLDGTEMHLAVNPEFLREGAAVQDFFHPDRLLFGVFDTLDASALRHLYQDIKTPVITTDPRTAELAKHAANVFLATRISFINEIASVCQDASVDVDPVIETLGLDARLGASYLSPGIGFGGSCLPKDLAATCHFAESIGTETPLLRQVEATNNSMPLIAVEAIRSALGGLAGGHVAVWGLTFKSGTNDLRASPALDVVRLLNQAGASVTAYDPAIGEEDAIGVPSTVAGDPVSAARGADCLAILTDWPQFREIDFDRVREALWGDFVFDGRNLLDRAPVETAGLRYQGVGRPLTGRATGVLALGRIEG